MRKLLGMLLLSVGILGAVFLFSCCLGGLVFYLALDTFLYWSIVEILFGFFAFCVVVVWLMAIGAAWFNGQSLSELLDEIK